VWNASVPHACRKPTCMLWNECSFSIRHCGCVCKHAVLTEFGVFMFAKLEFLENESLACVVTGQV